MSAPLRILHGAFGRVVLLQVHRSMALHAHRDCHIVFKVGGGEIQFGVGRREHPVTAQSVLMINTWEPHFYDHRGPEPCVLLALYLHPRWLKEVDRIFTRSAGPKFFTRPVALLNRRLAGLRDDILDLLSQHEPAPPEAVEALIADVFTEAVTLTAPLSRLRWSGAHGELGYDARIRQVVEGAMAGSNAPLCLDELAQSAGLSRAQFFRLFLRSTGLTPKTFVNMLRMEECLKSVVRRDTPLQQIALQCGFDTAGNFTRFFSARQGMVPSKYRRVAELLGPDDQDLRVRSPRS